MLGADAVDVAAEDRVHVDPAGEFVVAAAEMGERDDVVDALVAEFVDRLLGGLVGVGERERRRLGVDRVGRGISQPEEADALAVGLGDRPRHHAFRGAEALAVLVAGVGADPGERAVGDELAGRVGAVVEVVVAERVRDGVGRVGEVEQLPPAGRERHHAGGAVVAGADDEGVVAVEVADPAGEAARPLGVVEEVLDIGVVKQTNHRVVGESRSASKKSSGAVRGGA